MHLNFLFTINKSQTTPLMLQTGYPCQLSKDQPILSHTPDGLLLNNHHYDKRTKSL